MDKKLAECCVTLYFSRFQITLLFVAKVAIFFELRLIPGRNSLCNRLVVSAFILALVIAMPYFQEIKESDIQRRSFHNSRQR